MSEEEEEEEKEIRLKMPSRFSQIEPAVPANNKTCGTYRSLLSSGSRFTGSQKSKGNSYDVEVILQVSYFYLRRNFSYSNYHGCLQN